jgi:uncharacterized membrane protein (DUF2068 family)
VIGPSSRASTAAIKTVALFEAFKALLSLALAFGLLWFLDRDVHEIALRLVTYFHLNPAAKYPRILLEAAEHTGNSRIELLALGALAYTSMRAAEAYGLWFERAWAEVLAAASTALYIPFELYELVHRPSGIGLAIIVANLAVVAIMLHALSMRRKRARLARTPTPSC